MAINRLTLALLAAGSSTKISKLVPSCVLPIGLVFVIAFLISDVNTVDKTYETKALISPSFHGIKLIFLMSIRGEHFYSVMV